MHKGGKRISAQELTEISDRAAQTSPTHRQVEV
ncbi:addiction module toxin RelE [Enterobacteriaceae bacterium A-F18]|nr:addiction module toxin RelE [Enterobacteriaceae bacterium ENNIH3]AUV09969.1 addiction module toxin RelE [Enterobacteriaceae bacterium ENNIH2]PWF51544.1 addiction module toxin RelE [[Kluyvera] intestini]QIH64578.1 addiction module toxin RelE [Enterobacteriaceae bacterium A-F18]